LDRPAEMAGNCQHSDIVTSTNTELNETKQNKTGSTRKTRQFSIANDVLPCRWARTWRLSPAAFSPRPSCCRGNRRSAARTGYVPLERSSRLSRNMRQRKKVTASFLPYSLYDW